MPYLPISGVADKWSRAQAENYMRTWSAKGRSKAAIRNYLIAEDVCDAPSFQGKCASQLDAAWTSATGKAASGKSPITSVVDVFTSLFKPKAPAAAAIGPAPSFLQQHGTKLLLAGAVVTGLVVLKKKGKI